MIISVNNLRLRGNHGVMAQERTIGNDFTVSFSLDFPEADQNHDRLEETINYAEAVEIVKKEFAIPSQLLEHVALRIGRALKGRWPGIVRGSVNVAKLTPPIAGISLDSVSITHYF